MTTASARLSGVSLARHELKLKLVPGQGRIVSITLGQAVKLFHSSTLARAGERNSHRKTLNLPATAFEIRANAAVRDHLFRRRTTESLYKWQKDAYKDNQPWFLQDGPPYANGSLHMGHLMNKVVKDIVNRYYLLQRRRIFFTPGWDTHGLPIELKVQGMPEMQGRSPVTADPLLIRELARKIAGREIQRQKDEFKELAILADWEADIYHTYDAEYELKQLQVIAEMVKKGLMYRALRPVHYSPSTRTALADAELEYNDNHVSRTVFVAYGLKAGPALRRKLSHPDVMKVLDQGNLVDIEALIWTTTSWSLPGNMAIAVNPTMKYCVVRAKEGTWSFKQRLFIVAFDRVGFMSRRKLGLALQADRPTMGDLEVLDVFDGEDLLDSTYTHPFLPQGRPFCPILPADYVTADSGTGLVHTAPAHGMDDYNLCLRHGLLGDPSSPNLTSTIDEHGCFTSVVAELNRDAAKLVGSKALVEGAKQLRLLLNTGGFLLSELPLQHRYPYDWRSKMPIMMRATSQWFVDVSRLKEKAKIALQKVQFIPPTSRARLEKTIASRNEWCVSRQRPWGVPIPVVYKAGSAGDWQPLLTPENVTHIISILREKGIDYWWQGPAEEFVAPEYRESGSEWRIGTDTIDVWFDSGVSWSAARASPAAQGEGSEDVADLYAEGTDQHRGWFQSSLLTKLAFQPEGEAPQAPFKTVATHGYVLNRRHEKMSKSLGNYIDPMMLIKGGAKKKEPAWGADTLRLWAAKSYVWESDINISQLQAKHANEDLRKLRNTAKFLLSVLPPPDQTPSLNDELVQKELTLLDRFILSELHGLDAFCRASYEELNYSAVFRRLSEFMSATVSTLYFSIIKDTLYIRAPDDPKRQAALAVCEQLLRTTASIMAPIVPHLVEEIWYYRSGATTDPPARPDPAAPREPSFFELGWQGVDHKWRDVAAVKDWRRLAKLRDELLSLIEEGRRDKLCKSAAELEVTISLPEEGQVDPASSQLMDICKAHEADLPVFLSAAYVKLSCSPPAIEVNAEGKQTWFFSRTLTNLSASSNVTTSPPPVGDFEAFVDGAAAAEAPQLEASGDPEMEAGAPAHIELTIKAAKAAACPRCWLHRAPSPIIACDRCLSIMKQKEVQFVSADAYLGQKPLERGGVDEHEPETGEEFGEGEQRVKREGEGEDHKA